MLKVNLLVFHALVDLLVPFSSWFSGVPCTIKKAGVPCSTWFAGVPCSGRFTLTVAPCIALRSFLVFHTPAGFLVSCSRRFAAVPLFHALVGYLVILTCLLVFLAPAGLLVFQAL
jgi:hypothetical protein